MSITVPLTSFSLPDSTSAGKDAGPGKSDLYVRTPHHMTPHEVKTIGSIFKTQTQPQEDDRRRGKKVREEVAPYRLYRLMVPTSHLEARDVVVAGMCFRSSLLF